MNIAEHPTVRRFREGNGEHQQADDPKKLDAAWLRQLCLDCGADDAGLVEIARPAIDDQTRRHSACVSSHQDASQLRLPDEP